MWGSPISTVFEDGMLLIQQARSNNKSGLVCVLLEGPPNAGKTAIAAQLAKNSDFPFIKVCSPDDMVGYTESAKCLQIRKVKTNVLIFKLQVLELFSESSETIPPLF